MSRIKEAARRVALVKGARLAWYVAGALRFVPYPLSGARPRSRFSPDVSPDLPGWRDRLQRALAQRALALMSRAVLR